MTRGEEIRNAIDTIFPIHPFDKGRKYEQALMATGFEAGVKWADANPKSPWISVEDDLPCNHDDMYNMSGSLIYTDNVLALAGNKPVIACMMFNDNTGEWKWDKPLNIKYWMSVPKLPKK